jgi:3-oxoacyl-[acyl-carrier-protein] synthase-3
MKSRSTLDWPAETRNAGAMTIGIAGIEYRLAAGAECNADLSVDFPHTNLEQLVKRTGVLKRSIAAPGETALDLAETACRRLMQNHAAACGEIDGLIFCTQTPDHVMPPNACLLQARLGLPTSIMAFDITLACSGYIYALQIARSLVAAGAARTVLVVTGDTYSRLIDRQDRSTRALFGDGAAASLVCGGAAATIVDALCATDGAQGKRFWIPAGGAREPANNEAGTDAARRSKIHMDGFGVLSYFTAVVPDLIARLLERNRLTIGDIDLCVFHQASRVALEALQVKLGIANDRFVLDMQDFGNLVSASLPVALVRAQQAGRIRPGARVLLCGFGVGLSWGAALLQY